jgi:hypothetical protein
MTGSTARLWRKRAADVDRHHTVPLLLGRVDDRFPNDVSGVVDEDVDALPAAEGSLDRPFRRVCGRGVALDRDDAVVVRDRVDRRGDVDCDNARASLA